MRLTLNRNQSNLMDHTTKVLIWNVKEDDKLNWDES